MTSTEFETSGKSAAVVTGYSGLSGKLHMAVKKWCVKQGINVNTYYRRERMVLVEAQKREAGRETVSFAELTLTLKFTVRKYFPDIPLPLSTRYPQNLFGI